MTTLTITKDNFIEMIPKMYQFFEESPEVVVISTSETKHEEEFYTTLIQQGLNDIKTQSFSPKPWY